MKRLIRVLTSDLTPLRWVLGWLGVLLSIGFLTASTDNSNYEFINTLYSRLIWFMMFFTYGAMLIGTSMYNIAYHIRSILSVVGIFLWSYVFLSFTFYDKTPIYATEWMLLIPVIVECWLLAELPKRRSVK